MWLLAELQCSDAIELIQNDEAMERFTEKARRAAAWLVDTALALNPSLWSYFTFANAYGAFSLSRQEELDDRTRAALLVAGKWLSRQATVGELEDVEDAALAGLAILGILKHLDPQKSIRIREFPKQHDSGN